MKKKGFTLIEMLVTVFLLAIIGTVISVNLIGINKQQETKEEKRLKNALTVAADAYIHKNEVVVNDTILISVNTLVEEGYLNANFIGEYNDYSIKVTKRDNSTYIYEIKQND